VFVGAVILDSTCIPMRSLVHHIVNARLPPIVEGHGYGFYLRMLPFSIRDRRGSKREWRACAADVEPAVSHPTWPPR
jgi:hypothetical protein